MADKQGKTDQAPGPGGIKFRNPVRVSPLIRVARWSLLGLGILYGSTRNSVLSKQEAERRAKEEEERPAREAAMKAEKDAKYMEEMEYLRSIGIDLGPTTGKSPVPHGVGCGCGCKN